MTRRAISTEVHGGDSAWWARWVQRSIDEVAERAVIKARIEYNREDAIREDLDRTVDTIVGALRASGYEPTINLDNVESSPPRT